ncbi:MAG: hypothetical protein GY832_11665 [Chloroflexi bacterium]|nr:hypothetical protein [Chloroflexota bacterium]
MGLLKRLLSPGGTDTSRRTVLKGLAVAPLAAALLREKELEAAPDPELEIATEEGLELGPSQCWFPPYEEEPDEFNGFGNSMVSLSPDETGDEWCVSDVIVTPQERRRIKKWKAANG